MTSGHAMFLGYLVSRMHAAAGAAAISVVLLEIPTDSLDLADVGETEDVAGRGLSAKAVRGFLYRVGEEYKHDPDIVLWTLYDESLDRSFIGLGRVARPAVDGSRREEVNVAP